MTLLKKAADVTPAPAKAHADGRLAKRLAARLRRSWKIFAGLLTSRSKSAR